MQALISYCTQWSNFVPQQVIQKGKEFYYCTVEPSGNWFSAGVYLGYGTEKEFTPTLALLAMIAPHTTRKITVDEKQSFLLTCKRDLLDIKTPHKELMVVNENGEFIALVKKERDILKPIMEIGEYMRK